MFLQESLDSSTVEGVLYKKLDGDKIRCFACGHCCVIFPDKRGICQVRYNSGGVLRVPYGYVAGIQSDPVEKKPFFHVLTGSKALTFGMLGCDFHCGYCQNWVTSQALRDKTAGVTPKNFSPERIVQLAKETDARLVVSSYNEPLITVEWAVAIFKQAKKAGLLTGFVSNGHASPEALDYIQPYIDCYKVDLKSMQEKNYRSLGGRLKDVLWTVEELHKRGIWLEVLTLLVPGFNDSQEELQEIASFIVSLSPNIPWHITAFHQAYKMIEPNNSTSSDLIRAAKIGVEVGLHFVYAGNRPGNVGGWENSYCPQCRTVLIERLGYIIQTYNLTDSGACPNCQYSVPGLW